MRFDTAATSRHGIEYFGYTMADIATYDVCDKEQRDKDTDGRENKIEEVRVFCHKSRREQMLDFLNQGFKYKCRKTCAHTYHKAEHQNDLPF